MARARWLHISLLVVVIAAFPVLLYLPQMETGVLFLSPAIVLFVALLAGCYVGEERLARLVAARHPGRRRRERTAIPVGAILGRALRPRGGRLVATSLAVRPPPALLALR